MEQLVIRETAAEDMPAIVRINRRAFGHDVEADLVRDILADPTAAPRLSLIAEQDGQACGYVMFSSVSVDGAEAARSASILAPLAVDPDAQGQGVGGALVKNGVKRLKEFGVALVFVLGDPAYYGRFGFAPARVAGLEPPFDLPEDYHPAWMAMTLGPGRGQGVSGRVRCCDALNRRELWVE